MTLDRARPVTCDERVEPSLVTVHDYDRKAVERVIGALCNNLVDDLDVSIRLDPIRDPVADLLALSRLRRGKYFDAGDVHLERDAPLKTRGRERTPPMSRVTCVDKTE